MIQGLRRKKESLDRAIEAIEGLYCTTTGEAASIKKRPGRKGMSEEERQEVSKRMKRYWASRRGE
jgi:hypothetical protein